MRDASKFAAEQLREDDELRRLHLQDAILTLFSSRDERGVALLMLRDIVNATCGFPTIAQHIGSTPKSVMGMLSSGGNPTMKNLMSIIRFLIAQEGGHPEFKIAI